VLVVKCRIYFMALIIQPESHKRVNTIFVVPLCSNMPLPDDKTAFPLTGSFLLKLRYNKFSKHIKGRKKHTRIGNKSPMKLQ
jgi:hypothetical protein